jgi:hypothetical protein
MKDLLVKSLHKMENVIINLSKKTCYDKALG